MTHIAYLAPEFGTVSSTFVYREILALQDLGFKVSVFATLAPASKVMSAEVAPLAASTVYLYSLSKARILQAAAWMKLRHPAAYLRGAGWLVHDLARARMAKPADRLKLVWQFCAACELARQLLDRGVQHIHAHFAHVPTTVAMYGARMAGIPFSFTAHANDIFDNYAALREKTHRARFTAVISAFNQEWLRERGCDTRRMHIVRCGINTSDYGYRPPAPVDGPLKVLSVARLVEKKGIGVLLRALAQLNESGFGFECKIAGDGPLLEPLKRQASASGLGGAVQWLGSRPQEEIRELFRWTNVFALPCVVDERGDRDGIPVALMEAMALGVPVISTAVSGIPELIQDGQNGLLAREDDAESLANALRSLASEPELSQRLATAARKTIEDEFEIRRSAARLAELIRA